MRVQFDVTGANAQELRHSALRIAEDFFQITGDQILLTPVGVATPSVRTQYAVTVWSQKWSAQVLQPTN